MTVEAPTISAIVPVHNGAALIGEALRSIRAQSVPVSEVIVVDDGSTDETAEIVRSVDPDAILVRKAQRGPASARNEGAVRATGTFLAFLDHDDLWPPDRTAALLEGLAAMPEAALVCGRVDIRPAPGLALEPRLLRANGTHVPFLFPSLLLRREAWLEAGGMDPERDRSEDVDLYLRLVERGVAMARIEATSVIYRLHGGNRSRAVDLSSNALLATLRAAIVRRRGRADSYSS